MVLIPWFDPRVEVAEATNFNSKAKSGFEAGDRICRPLSAIYDTSLTVIEAAQSRPDLAESRSLPSLSLLCQIDNNKVVTIAIEQERKEGTNAGAGAIHRARANVFHSSTLFNLQPRSRNNCVREISRRHVLPSNQFLSTVHRPVESWFFSCKHTFYFISRHIACNLSWKLDRTVD